MSSVTRFIRQVPVSTTYYSVPSAMSSAGTGVYEFVPTAANVVQNYPPGYMQGASLQLLAALASGSLSASTCVLRDMGKTFYAPVGSSASAVSGWFRQVQLLLPQSVSASQGFIGGTAGSTFGVLGGSNIPDAYTDYFTFYIAVPLGGTLGGTISGAVPIAGGQM